MKRELLDNTKVVPLLDPTTTALSAGTTVTTWVSRKAFLSAIASLATGAATGSPTSYTVVATVQTADDASGTNATNLLDLAGNNVYTISLAADNANAQVDCDVVGGKEYFALSIVTTFVDGTTPAVPVNAFAVFGDSEDTREF